MNRSAVALVTGATSGLGGATAMSLNKRGFTVIASGRDRLRGEAIVAEMNRARPQSAHFLSADISSSASVSELFASISEDFGDIEVAVNNAASAAGVGRMTADSTEDDFDLQIATTLKGTWLCMREELRIMSKGAKGSIVNVASINGLSGTRGAPAYAAAKHGVIGLTKSAALEYGPSGVRVNAVCPGPFDTPMLQEVISISGGSDPEGFAAAYRAHIPVGRFGEAQEAGELIAWLAADAPAYINGASIVADGGMTA